MNLPLKDPVLIPTRNHQQRAVATAAAFSLSTLVEQHNVQRKADRHALEVREAEEPFLWGQDFDIEPEVWEQDEDIEASLRGL